MRLHWKLMALLALFGLLPAVAVGWVGREAIRDLGSDIARQARDLVYGEVSSDLQETIRQAAASVDQQRRIIELSLRLQAEAVADVLASAPEGALPPLPPLADRFQNLDQAAGQGGLRRFLALPTGETLTWPPDELLPSGPPQDQPWFEAAAEAEGPVWATPTVDPVTGEPVLKAVAPVRDPNGQLTAVTGIDVPVVSGLARLREQGNLPDGTTALLVLTEPVPGAPAGSLPILAQAVWEEAEGSDTAGPATWRTEASSLLHRRHREYPDLVQALQEGESGTVWMPWEGENALWAFGALGGMEAGLIYVVPQNAIEGIATAVTEAMEEAVAQQMAATGGVVLLILALAFAGSWFGARSVTRPLRSLRNTMDQVAAGDLDARAVVDTGDEVGEAARHFNRVVPLLADRMALKRSLALAQDVQQSLLPQGPPKLPGFDIAGLSRYSDETGGDYFDYVPLRTAPDGQPRRLAVLVGDVAGHGVSAALLMTTVRAQLRARAEGADEPSSLLAAVNPLLAADARAGRFMTLFCVFLTAGQRLITWSSAGHDPALLVSGEQRDTLAGEDIPLGIEHDWRYAPSDSRMLNPGDVLVIGTDGLWETRNRDGEMFSQDYVVEIIRRHPDADADTLCRLIAETVETFRGGARQRDDVTIVVIRALSRLQ